MGYKDFTEMPIWQQGFQLLVRTYEITKSYPPEERFGLVSDMRRSVNSMTHNIAEGYGRFEPKDKTRFYKISRGSSYEFISQLLVSAALSYISETTRDSLIKAAKNMIEELNALMHSIESEPQKKAQAKAKDKAKEKAKAKENKTEET